MEANAPLCIWINNSHRRVGTQSLHSFPYTSRLHSLDPRPQSSWRAPLLHSDSCTNPCLVYEGNKRFIFGNCIILRVVRGDLRRRLGEQDVSIFRLFAGIIV